MFICYSLTHWQLTQIILTMALAQSWHPFWTTDNSGQRQVMTFIILENSYSNQGAFITNHDAWITPTHPGSLHVAASTIYNRYDYMMIWCDSMIDMIWWLITVFTLQWNKYHIIYSLYFDVFFTVCIEVFWRSFPAIVCLLGSRSRSMRTTMPWHTKMSLRAKWEGQETGNVCCQGLFADLRYWTAVKSASIVICFLMIWNEWYILYRLSILKSFHILSKRGIDIRLRRFQRHLSELVQANTL